MVMHEIKVNNFLRENLNSIHTFAQILFHIVFKNKTKSSCAVI